MEASKRDSAEGEPHHTQNTRLDLLISYTHAYLFKIFVGFLQIIVEMASRSSSISHAANLPCPRTLPLFLAVIPCSACARARQIVRQVERFRRYLGKCGYDRAMELPIRPQQCHMDRDLCWNGCSSRGTGSIARERLREIGSAREGLGRIRPQSENTSVSLCKIASKVFDRQGHATFLVFEAPIDRATERPSD